MRPTGGATIADFSADGLDSAYDLGPVPCTICALQTNNRNVGAFGLYHSGGRSVYNGMDLKLTQNVRHPFTGVKYLNFQATYTLSRYVNAGSTTSGSTIAGGDADFLSLALDNRNPLSLTGPGSLDRAHQFNFGGYADLPVGFCLGLISHFWSPKHRPCYPFRRARFKVLQAEFLTRTSLEPARLAILYRRASIRAAIRWAENATTICTM